MDLRLLGDWAIVQDPRLTSGAVHGFPAAQTTRPCSKTQWIPSPSTKSMLKLVENEMQFSNNTKVNQKFADDPNYGNEFLGRQNDTAEFVELAKNIKFEHKTQYDQLLNEQLPGVFLDYFLGNITEDQAYANYYQYVNEKYPAIITPDEA